jgi:hypothetical protein
VRESIVGTCFCCQCACHTCQWGPAKVLRFGSISDFLGSWAFEYYMYYIEITNSWNLCRCFCLRKVECSLYECWCTSGLALVPCLWWSCGHFDRFVIFSGFIVWIWIFRYRLFEAKLCGSPYLLWSAVVAAHVIRVGEAHPKCRDLHRPPICWALELFNAICNV